MFYERKISTQIWRLHFGCAASPRSDYVSVKHDPFWDPYWYDRYSYYNQYVFSSSDRAVNQGYHDGLKTGQGDVEHRRTYNPERSHYFQDAGFGNFAAAYREGFARGYSDGFRSLG